MRPAHTRIPEIPNQTIFLEKWYEFHRGYRIVVDEAGAEQRVEVTGEDFKDVPPGQLPRTAQELAQGLDREPATDVSWTAQVGAQDAVQPSLETALDDLFDQAVQEESQALAANDSAHATRNVHAQAMTQLHSSAIRNTAREQRRVATLRRELVRMRNGIERVIGGLRELGETVPDHAVASDSLQSLGQTLDDIAGSASSQARPDDTAALTLSLPERITQAQERLAEARRMQEQAVAESQIMDEEVRLSERRLQHLRREQRTTENYVRLFGTREEVQAAGDNYESPIGGMFNRAWERFRAAEEVRQEERTLRQVLASEAAAGGEEATTRLERLQVAERDVWDVPRLARADTPEVRLMHQDTSNTTQLMEMARDEVFSGQQSSQHTSDIDPAGEQHEDLLGTYYNLLRRQDGNQMRDLDNPQSFPQMMLSDHPSRAIANESADGMPLAELDDTSQAPRQTLASSQPYETDLQSLTLDASFLAQKITDDEFRGALGLTSAELNDIERHTIYMSTGNPDAIEMFQSTVLSNDAVVWAAELPAQRARRARHVARPLLLTDNIESEAREEKRQNIEAMAQAFERSAEVRRHSRRSAPEQLRILYRLQRGKRSVEDRVVLWELLMVPAAVAVARRVLAGEAFGYTSEDNQRTAQLDEQRRDAARAGQHTRQHLQSMRQESSAIAVAAGRAAMHTGHEAIYQRLLEIHDGYMDSSRFGGDLAFPTELPRPRAARRQEHSPADVSDSDSDDETTLRALDAPNTGRPEPKSDEELTVKMDCKICFSQVADIACLPCGHLVMCKWCSDQHSPVFHHDQTRPRRPASCPSCRKQIKQKVRVFSV